MISPNLSMNDENHAYKENHEGSKNEEKDHEKQHLKNEDEEGSDSLERDEKNLT